MSALMLENMVTFLLCLGPLPSFIAWSEGAGGLSAFLAAHTGPINPLKLAAPLFFFYFWKNRAAFSRKVLLFFGTLLFIGTLSALYAGIRCNQPWIEMREWAATVVGCVCGGCFAILPRKKALLTCYAWIGILLSSVALELIFPSALKWIVFHFFDPARANLDRHGIMGFWDIASLAKMSMMTLWIFGMTLFRDASPVNRSRWILFSVLALIFFIVILGTTERGPLLGLMVGSLVFVIQEVRRTRIWRIAAAALALGLLGSAVAWVVIPHEVLVPRIRTMFFLKDKSELGLISSNAIDERFKINQLTFAIIRNYPFGNACISEIAFIESGMPRYHAHNLILQQFRSKGWVWGTLHLSLWLLAILFASNPGRLIGNFLFAGVLSVFALGLVDHPWFVLNQATMIGALLMSCFLASRMSPKVRKFLD